MPFQIMVKKGIFFNFRVNREAIFLNKNSIPVLASTHGMESFKAEIVIFE